MTTTVAPDFTAAAIALAAAREQVAYLWEDARLIAFDYDTHTGEVTVFNAYTGVTCALPAKRRDIGRRWTEMCREDLAAAMADYYRTGVITLHGNGLHYVALV